MGKNKTKKFDSESIKGKTQELEDINRVSKGFERNNPKKSK